jgi:hypothetical protein
MDKVLQIFNFIATNYQAIISALIGILSSIVAIALMIPGDQPEKTLQSIVDFLAKFSKK